MYINFKLKSTNNWKAKALQEARLDELEQLGKEIYSSNDRKIFKIDKQKIKLIKWNRPTKQMLKELHNRSQPKIVHINTASTKYLDHCSTEAIQADNGYEFLTRMYTRLSHAVLNLKPRAEYTETRRIKYNLNKANAS